MWIGLWLQLGWGVLPYTTWVDIHYPAFNNNNFANFVTPASASLVEASALLSAILVLNVLLCVQLFLIL